MEESNIKRDFAFRYEDFGNKLLQIAEENDMSIFTIAETIGYERKACHRWVKGENVPNADAICTICRIYGVSADWLLGLGGK